MTEGEKHWVPTAMHRRLLHTFAVNLHIAKHKDVPCVADHTHSRRNEGLLGAMQRIEGN